MSGSHLPFKLLLPVLLLLLPTTPACTLMQLAMWRYADNAPLASHSVHCHCCHSRAAMQLCLVVACKSSPVDIQQACITAAQQTKCAFVYAHAPCCITCMSLSRLGGQLCRGVLLLHELAFNSARALW